MVRRMIPVLSHPTNPASCDVTHCLPWLGELLDLVDPGGFGGTSYCMIFMQNKLNFNFALRSVLPTISFNLLVWIQVKIPGTPQGEKYRWALGEATLENLGEILGWTDTSGKWMWAHKPQTDPRIGKNQALKKFLKNSSLTSSKFKS
jgi:hypothetical protein